MLRFLPIMLLLTQLQVAQLAEPPRKKQREQTVLEMEAAWRMFSPKWKPFFKREFTYEERKHVYGQIYDWGIERGLQRKAHYMMLALMMMRAMYYGFEQSDIDMAMGQMEAYIDEGKPQEGLDWIKVCIDMAEEE